MIGFSHVQAEIARELIAAQPDVMLASWCGKPFDAEAVMQREGAMQSPPRSSYRRAPRA